MQQSFLFVLLAISGVLASPLALAPTMPACAQSCVSSTTRPTDCDPALAECFCSSNVVSDKIGNCLLNNCEDDQDLSDAILSLPDCRTADQIRNIMLRLPIEVAAPGPLDTEDEAIYQGQTVMKWRALK
ncbi:hypothetical protein BD626DRAFT_533548 [Schizophyllum amplum]|uniref:CFEM domain-containing protein n=1 Tax=Schizophyllum amplum TaxID=97359 RepID=A0A550CZH1_9AGAR|nr:hypothetical protein BD626DRAFT_533548 [Auriculariopsis ampla]